MRKKKIRNPTPYKLRDQNLWLTPERCIFWEEKKALILTDLHFGKTGHFRKMGVAVPQDVFKTDLQRLFHLVQHFQPAALIITGDFFHSSKNLEVEYFLRWREALHHLQILLVKGNHDILTSQVYEKLKVETIDGVYKTGPFCFTHDRAHFCDDYTFSGHIHPGIKMRGAGKKTLALPCYYFSNNYAILPAFSLFTGLALLKPKKEDAVFAIAGDEVVQVN